MDDSHADPTHRFPSSLHILLDSSTEFSGGNLSLDDRDTGSKPGTVANVRRRWYQGQEEPSSAPQQKQQLEETPQTVHWRTPTPQDTTEREGRVEGGSEEGTPTGTTRQQKDSQPVRSQRRANDSTEGGTDADELLPAWVPRVDPESRIVSVTAKVFVIILLVGLFVVLPGPGDLLSYTDSDSEGGFDFDVDIPAELTNGTNQSGDEIGIGRIAGVHDPGVVAFQNEANESVPVQAWGVVIPGPEPYHPEVYGLANTSANRSCLHEVRRDALQVTQEYEGAKAIVYFNQSVESALPNRTVNGSRLRVGEVYTNQTTISIELAARGTARVANYSFSTRPNVTRAQTMAQTQNRGVWGCGQPPVGEPGRNQTE